MTSSPNSVHLVGGVRVPMGGRVKSYTPLIVPGHGNYHHNHGNPNYEQRMRTSSSSPSVEKSQEFYAGAKFDFSPAVASLPTPPTQWTIPLLRSQSQPSSPSPVTTTNHHASSSGTKITTTRIDVNSLFLSPQVIKASSFPGNEMAKKSNEKIEREGRLETQKTKKTVSEKISQSRNRNWNEDLLKSEKKSAFTNTNTSTNITSKSTKNSTPKNQLKMESKSKPIHHYHHHRPIVQVIESKQTQMYPHLSEHLAGLLKVQG
jgi:hypothetical protein